MRFGTVFGIFIIQRFILFLYVNHGIKYACFAINRTVHNRNNAMISFRATLVRLFPVLLTWGQFRALIAAGAFAGGIATTSFIINWLHPFAGYRLLIGAFAVFCMMVGCIVMARRWSAVAFFIAGLLMHCFQILTQQEIVQDISENCQGITMIALRVISPPAPYHEGFRYLAKVKNGSGHEAGIPGGLVFSCSGSHFPEMGDELTVAARVMPGSKPANRYDFDEYVYFMANGIAGKIAIDSVVSSEASVHRSVRFNISFRAWLAGVFKLYDNPHHRALIRASFTGEKSYIAPGITDAFMRSGLIHLLALSGFNAAIVLAAVYALLFLLPLHVNVKHSVALAVLWLYFLFIGPIPSLTRAIIMATMVIVAIMTQRKNYPLQTLGLAALVWLTLSPSSLFQPGFQLSYAATFGILTLHPLFIKALPFKGKSIPERWLQVTLQALSVSVAAFLCTLPVVLHHFGTCSLYGIIANIPAIPLMSCAMWFFFAALFVNAWLPLAGKLLVSCSALAVDCLLSIARFSEQVPFSSVKLPVPWTELTIIFVAVLMVGITIGDRWKKPVLLIAVPLFVCLIPADFLVRRMLLRSEVVFFAPLQRESLCAIRLSWSEVWIFGNSGTRYLPRQPLNVIDAWLRHRPGIVSKQYCICNEALKLLDSGGKKVADGKAVDSITIKHAPSATTATFYPEKKAIRMSRGQEIIEWVFADSVVCLQKNADAVSVKSRAPRPARFILDKKGCREVSVR